MFYLLATNKMVTATPKKVLEDGTEVDQPQEFKGLRVIQEAEDMETLQGFIALSTEDLENPIYQEVFLVISDDEGKSHNVFLLYDWLPTKLICRLEPPVDEIKEFVPTREVIVNPHCLKAVNKHKKEQAKFLKQEAAAAE